MSAISLKKYIDGLLAPVLTALSNTNLSSAIRNLVTGAGLTGGPITTSTGTIALAPFVGPAVLGVTGTGSTTPTAVPFSSDFNLNSGTIGIATALRADIVGAEQLVNKGVAGGYPSLDNTGHVPLSQIPAGVLGGLTPLGTWNAATNTPTLTSTPPTTSGSFYVVSVAGTTPITCEIGVVAEWAAGDLILSDGTHWNKVDGATNTVISVAGRTGIVVLSHTDIAGLGALATAALPGVGLVYSDGTVLSDAILGPDIGWVNGNTLTTDAYGTITLTGTTGTINTAGLSAALIKLPIGTMTITLNGGYVNQKFRGDLQQPAGGTCIVNFASPSVIWGSDITGFTASTTSGAVDMLLFITPNGTNYRVSAADHGFNF